MGVYKKPVSKRVSVKKRKQTSRKSMHKYRSPRPNSLGFSGGVSGGRITGLGNAEFGFPDKLKTKLLYCDVITMSSALGAVADWVYRMNSLYDPDYTSTGHQPQWYDQLSAVYDHYRVLGSKITARIVPTKTVDTEANDSGPFIVGVTGSQSAVLSASSYPTLLEDGSSNNDIIVDKQGSKNCATVSTTYTPFRDLGTDPYDDTVSAGTTGSPSKQFYAHIWCKDMDTTASTRVVVQVQIEYTCEFFGRIEGVLS